MEKNSREKVAIIGYGRFGKVLAELLKKDFDLLIYDPVIKEKSTSLEKALEAKTLFLAVPISAFSELIHTISKKLLPGTTVMDVCSVKMHPVKIMQEFLPATINIIATHPMFGPDSFKENQPLKIVMHKVRDTSEQYAFWKNYFETREMTVIEMTPEAHDKSAAFSQGVTHYIGRILETMNLHSTPIDTVGFQKLLSVKEQTCRDTWQLYCDLQHYNPFSKEMHAQLEDAIDILSKKSQNP